jgi:hypothetical protein
MGTEVEAVDDVSNERLEENVGAVNIELTHDDLREIESAA